MRKKSISVTNMGSVSLLMIFIVLCLVTFATLSLSSAVGNYHFSEKLGTHTTQYYQASNTATSRLSELDDTLLSAYKDGQAAYYSSAAALLEDKDWLMTDFTKPSPVVSYQVKINRRQALEVILELNAPDDVSNGFYRITSWKEIDTAEWNGDDSLHLMEG